MALFGSVDHVRQCVEDQSKWKWVLLGGGALALYWVKRRMGGQRCPTDADISGQTVIITGANCGIGKATALELAKRKARIILACRDVAAAEAAAKEIRQTSPTAEIVVRHLDLASLESVKSFSQTILSEEARIDVLINNAGVYGLPFTKTTDGFEMHMGVNHLGHFYLTNLLMDRLKASAPCRVVIVSSGLSKLGTINFEKFNSELEYKKSAAYANSKLANNVFARELSSKLEGSGVSVFCLRPGMVRSNLGRNAGIPSIVRFLFWPLAWLLVKSVDEGCQTVVYCSIAPELQGVSGKYYSNCQQEPWPQNTCDPVEAKNLWDTSAKLTGI